MRTIEIDLNVHRAIESARTSFEERETDILSRLLGLTSLASPSAPPHSHSGGTAAISVIPIGQRTTGNWGVVYKSQRAAARNLREAYLTALACIAEHAPRVLEQIAAEGDGRRRVTARSPEELYPSSPHLAEEWRNNWRELNGWYVDLNISRDQASKRIRRACTFAGLRYGSELAVMDNLIAL
jgi:hypothetical protein